MDVYTNGIDNFFTSYTITRALTSMLFVVQSHAVKYIVLKAIYLDNR